MPIWIPQYLTFLLSLIIGILTNVRLATLAENGDLDAEMTHRIQSGRKNWKGIRGFCVTEEYAGGSIIQDGCKTSNEVRCRDMGSEDSTRKGV